MNARAILGVLLTLVAASLAGGGVYAVHRLKQKRLDPQTLCPPGGSKAASLIVIDKTDPLTAAEKTSARGIIANEAAGAQRGDRITVRLLMQGEGTDAATLETAADLCNPGAEANPLFENPKRVAARYENAFRDPIAQALESVEDAGPAQSSPIALAIGESLAGIPENPGQRLKLTLISDLMEHAPTGSAYNGALSEAALRNAIPAASRERLHDAEIRILLLARPRYVKQQTAAIAAWRQLFRTLTAREPEFLTP
jgi:hypothetical protein